MQQQNKALFFGSLRNNEYNHRRFVRIFGENSMVYIETKTIEGFKLYSLGAYPTVVKTDNPDHKLVVDLFEVSDDAMTSIDEMERGAGYDSIKIDGATLYLFTMSEKEADKYYKHVESGDWSAYLKEKEYAI